jgi:hypothetical protein
MEKTIDVTKISDLELMKISIDLNNQIMQLQTQYSVVMNEYNRRVSIVEQPNKEK